MILWEFPIMHSDPAHFPVSSYPPLTLVSATNPKEHLQRNKNKIQIRMLIKQQTNKKTPNKQKQKSFYKFLTKYCDLSSNI